MSYSSKSRYKTSNWRAYNQALKQRGSLTVWLDPNMAWEAAPSGKRGRQQAYSDAAIQACLTLKVLFGLPLRQATGFMESLLTPSGLYWSVPDFSTLSRRQNTLQVAIPYRPKEGLHLLIDSTGIKVEGEGEWQRRKHGGSRRRIWRKIHIAVDEQTLEIRAVEVTSSAIGDAPVLPDLLNQIAPQEKIACVTADGAYDTRACHDEIAARGVVAVIPPRKNARHGNQQWTAAGRVTTPFNRQKVWGALLRKWSGYHRRSRVEAKINCIKQLGQRLDGKSIPQTGRKSPNPRSHPQLLHGTRHTECSPRCLGSVLIIRT